MAGETKAELMSDDKLLMVSCDQAQFARIMQSVRETVGFTEPTNEVVDLRVTDWSQWQRSAPPSRLRDRIGLVGCALFAFLFLFVFALGIVKIIEMFSK